MYSVDIGKAIKECRTTKGWTQHELSKRTGIATSHLSMMERNQRDPSMKALQAVANAFSMPLNVLVFLAAEPDDLKGISNEIQETLRRAATELLKLPSTDHLFS